MRIVQMAVSAGAFLIVVLVGGGYALSAWLDSRASVVFVDNSLEEGVTILVDGEEIGSLGPGEATVIDVEPGAHTLSARGAAGEVEAGSFEVDDEAGFRGLYSIGSKRDYVVVRAVYDAAGGDTQFHPVAAQERFVRLPADVSPDGIDLPFPDTVTTSGAGATLTHVCRYDASTETVGCPGA